MAKAAEDAQTIAHRSRCPLHLRSGRALHRHGNLFQRKVRQRADDFLRRRIVNGKLGARRNFGLWDGGHGRSSIFYAAVRWGLTGILFPAANKPVKRCWVSCTTPLENKITCVTPGPPKQTRSSPGGVEARDFEKGIGPLVLVDDFLREYR